MNDTWINQAKTMPRDPESGAAITRITTGTNIYCESPKASPDGRYFIINHAAPEGGGIHVVDVETMAHRPVATGAAISNSSYSEYMYLCYPPAAPGGTYNIRRLSMVTLKEEPVVTLENPPGASQGGNAVGGVASPLHDYLYYIIGVKRARQVVRVDLRTGKYAVIFEHPEISNPHMQVDPATGKDILIQHNRGSKIDENGNVEATFGPGGATHFMIDRDGKNFRQLAIGEPITCTSSGHSSWISNTGRIVVATDWVHNPPDRFDPKAPVDWTLDPRHPTTSLFTVGPGEARPTPIPTPEHRFFHVSASRCGKYAICNSTPGRKGHTDIVVVNLKTEKYRTIVGGIQDRMGPTALSPFSLPYFTADLKYVIFNAKEDPSLPDCQGYFIFAAKVPEGFLASLG